MGGGRLRLPAAARAARRRARHARPDAGAVRPARGDARRARATASCAFLREIRAAIHAEDAAGLERRRRARPGRRGAPRGRRLRAAPSRPSSAAAATCSARSRALDRVELWTSAATHALLPMLATDAGLRLQLATGTASHVRRFGELGRRLLAAGVRLRAGPGARPRRPRRARVLRGPDRRSPGSRPPAPGRHRGRPGGRADRLADRRAGLERPRRLPGARHLPRLPPPHRARPQAVEQRRRRRTTARPRWRSRASTRATSWSARGPPASADGGLLCCALDTELLGHWWYEGPAWLAAVLEEAPRQGLELVTVERGHRARRASERRRCAASTWGSRQGHVHLGLAAGRPTWRVAARAPSCAPSPPPPATRARARRSSAPPASCWPCRRATGPSWPPASWPATTRASACEAHGAELDAALGALTDSAAVPEPVRAQPRARPRPGRAHVALMRAP